MLCFLVTLALALGGVSLTAAAETDATIRKDYLEHLRKTKGVVDIRMTNDSGSGPSAFNLMIVSAGFQAKEADDFFALCETLTRSLFHEEPWKKYKDLVNVYGVMVDDEGPANSRVQVSGYDGQLLNCENKPAIEFANYAAKSDNTIVVHNSNFSTPTCGPWAMVTCNRSTAGDYLTIHHELGHSVGGLGDKYTQRAGRYDGSLGSLWEGKNATDQPNPLLSQWHYWTLDQWPGLFDTLKLPKTANVINVEGAAWATGFYRPEDKCLMLGGDSKTYCTICNEIMESCIFRTINLFEKVSPPIGERVLWKGETENFDLKTLKFFRDSKPWKKSQLEFHVNGKQVANSSNGELNFTLGGQLATPGYHQIGANFNVQSEFVRRDDGFLSTSRAWRVRVMPYEKPRLKMPPTITAQQGKAIRVPIQVEHSRKDLVNVQMEHAPDGAVLQGGSFEWLIAKPGAWRVDFTVSIDNQKAFTESLEINVKPNSPGSGPIEIKKLEPVDALVGKETTIQIEATASTEGQLLYHLLNPQDGMILDRLTGKLAWTPRVEQYGPHRLRFKVSNGTASAEGNVLIGVCTEAAPYLNSYLTTYNKDRNQWLKDYKDTPFLYEKIFGITRMLRERFSDIYTPALNEAKAMYPNLSPGMRETFMHELSRHAWTFVDRPGILEWLTEISKGGTSPSARNLQAQMTSIQLWRKVMDTELGGNPKHVGPLLTQFSKTNNPAVHAAIRRAVKTLYAKADDKNAFRNEVRTVLQKSKGRELAAMLPMLPSIEMPGKEEILLKFALDPDEEISRSAIETIDKLTATSTIKEVSSLSKLLVSTPVSKQRDVIAKLLSTICKHLNDRNKTQTAMLEVLETAKGPGRVDLLQLLPLTKDPKLDDLLKQFSTGTDSFLTAAAQKAQKYLKDEIGATEAFVASWNLSGPYPLEGSKTIFAPETGESAEWKPYQSTETEGARTVPLGDIFGGDNRVAYMKAVIQSDSKQTVLFGAGSDDGIDVWLNGKLIHSNDSIRAVNPDQDQFTGTLNSGKNIVLCKIRQHSQGWGGCLSIRATNGSAALGVSVVP